MKTNRRKLIDEIDLLDSDICLIRAGFTCIMCGKIANQTHHFFTKGSHGNVRFDPDNHCALCFGCHRYRVHTAGDTEELRDRIIQKIGDERFEFLKTQAYKRAEHGEGMLRHMLKYKQFMLTTIAELHPDLVSFLSGSGLKRLNKAKKAREKGELSMFLEGNVFTGGSGDDT